MSDDKGRALLPVQERTVDFYGDPIPVAQTAEGELYVPLRQLSEFLGLENTGQRQRVMRDDVLSQRARQVSITAADGKRYATLCLPLDLLPGWLFGIMAARVRPGLAEKLQRYRAECFRVLWQAFQVDVMTAAAPENPATMSLAQIRDMGLAIAQLAEQQMLMEQRVGTQLAAHDDRLTGHDTRLDKAAQVVGEIQRRLSAIEKRTAPAATVTDAQAADVSGQVKALAQLMTEKEPGKNHYQGVFMELYRRFGVSSYKLIRQEDYAAVLAFLDEWRRTAGGEG